jgi:hypothetical protein
MPFVWLKNCVKQNKKRWLKNGVKRKKQKCLVCVADNWPFAVVVK